MNAIELARMETDAALRAALALAIQLAQAGKGMNAFALAGGAWVDMESAGVWDARRREMFGIVYGIVPFPASEAIRPVTEWSEEEEIARAAVVVRAVHEVMVTQGEDAAARAWWAIYPESVPPWRMAEEDVTALRAKRRPH